MKNVFGFGAGASPEAPPHRGDTRAPAREAPDPLEAREFETSRRYTRAKALAAFKALAPDEDEDLADAKAHRTLIQYASAWNLYARWCGGEGLESMPASGQQLRRYVKHLCALTRAPKTIESYVAAIATVHRYHGHPIDRTLIVEHLKAARRGAGAQRRAKPLLGQTLRDLVARLDRENARDVRDEALLLLGFAAALRSEELIGLDWERPGREVFGRTGFITLEPKGLLLTLLRSKSAQVTAVELPIPDKEMPSLRPALMRWIKLANVQPGEPLFRATRSGAILNRRLAAETVLAIVQRRVRAYALATGKSRTEAAALALAYRSHSMRRGYATTASEAGVSLGHIRRRTRHADDGMLARYIDAAEGWRRSGLAGVGF
jgi:integrase